VAHTFFKVGTCHGFFMFSWTVHEIVLQACCDISGIDLEEFEMVLDARLVELQEGPVSFPEKS
jgi:hypothetical protein